MKAEKYLQILINEYEEIKENSFGDERVFYAVFLMRLKTLRGMIKAEKSIPPQN